MGMAQSNGGWVGSLGGGTRCGACQFTFPSSLAGGALWLVEPQPAARASL
jgi:hypothetical protein